MTATLPVPVRTPINAAYWDSLSEGRLSFQRCQSCGHAWLPPRAACTACLSEDFLWETACGRGKIVSWVVYRHAFNETFADRLPYNVTLVELSEGPRLLSNVTNPDAIGGMALNRDVDLVIANDEGFALPRFRLASK